MANHDFWKKFSSSENSGAPAYRPGTVGAGLPTSASHPEDSGKKWYLQVRNGINWVNHRGPFDTYEEAYAEVTDNHLKSNNWQILRLPVPQNLESEVVTKKKR